MSIEINPCQACRKHHPADDINAINNCVFETSAAFLNANSLSKFNTTNLYKHAQECVTDSKILKGRNTCEFRLQPSPIFVQVPNYFPDLYNEHNNKEISLQTCKEKCSKYSSYPGECQEKCEVQADAVVDNIEKYKPKPKHNFSYYFFYILFSIFFILLIIMFVQVLIK